MVRAVLVVPVALAVPVRGPGGPPPPTPEEVQKRVAEMQRNPPPLGTFAMHLSDYKKVDGIMLPHKIETSLDGEPNEEWTIEKYKVNPQIKAGHLGEEVTGSRSVGSYRFQSQLSDSVADCRKVDYETNH